MLLLLLACQEPPAIDSGPAELPRGALSLAFPLASSAAINQLVGVDHDPVVQQGIDRLICTNYADQGFPWCYDEHHGSDYMLDGGFTAMDAGSLEILAAVDGVVVDVEDGHYDRCHGDLDGVSCDGEPMISNKVVIEHETDHGLHQTLYFHMMKGSVAVEVGQQVHCGELLGLVGSSGNSSAPHLHFELQGPEGDVIDPYAGPASQVETWWIEQGPLEGYPSGQCAELD
jgi:murein DD-endopeptidase MepM/ murein hydrolase activator NlpD